MESSISFTLSYTGSTADDQGIELYDAGKALVGFHKSLALTTYLVLNGKVITRTPSTKNIHITALPPEEGSWKLKVVVRVVTWGLGGIFALGIAPKDSVFGHLAHSLYAYALLDNLGNPVPLEKILGQKFIEEYGLEEKLPDQSKLDALVENCETAIRDMHKPIVRSETATEAKIVSQIGRQTRLIEHPLNRETFEYIDTKEGKRTPGILIERIPQVKEISEIEEERLQIKHWINQKTFESVDTTEVSKTSEIFVGRVLLYSTTTFTGEIYIDEENRAVPFELVETARNPQVIECILDSLGANARNQHRTSGRIRCEAHRVSSASGRLKHLSIKRVWK